MIEKLNGLRHLKVTSNLKRDNKSDNPKNQENKNNNQNSDSQEKKENTHKDLLPIDLVIEKLNNNHYYKKKSMHFELLSSDDGETVLVKSNDNIIKRLSPSDIYKIFNRVKSQDEDSPIKGGLLNINI